MEESQHLVGGAILITLLFIGNYLPIWMGLLVMVSVTWLAMISFTSLRTAVLLSTIGFLIPCTIFALRDWKTFPGEAGGLRSALEISLELTLLCSMIFGAIFWVQSILKSQRAGFNEVIGACNLYIWIASIFACFYTIISKMEPGAFRAQEFLTKGLELETVKQNFNELYYFSFVTQTTLGYGDIVPVAHFARALAVSQAIIGQFYVAVVLTYILNLWMRDLGKQVRPHASITSDQASQKES
jgi:hypothetical protein